MTNQYANRYQVVKDSFWWRVKTGDGTRLAGKFHTEIGAQRMAAEMLTAFMDGKFIGERSVVEPAGVTETISLDTASADPLACLHPVVLGDDGTGKKWCYTCGATL